MSTGGHHWGRGTSRNLSHLIIKPAHYLSCFKDTFSCGPINMKFGPHKICSISTPKPTDQTDCTAKVMWAELRKSWKLGRTRRHNWEYCPIMNNDLVKMTSWDGQEGDRACVPKFSSNSIHTISLYWGRECCSTGIWNPIEILVWMHLTVFNNTCIIVMMAND